MTEKKIRFATIGTNFIVDRFLKAAQRCGGLEYAAVYSRKEETATRFAETYGVKSIYTDLEELAASEQIDAVYIASPNFLHCRQAVLMMEHGKHVICEKPAASNAQELEQMLDAAYSNQVIFLEAMRSVYDPGFAAIQENLKKLGKIRRADFRFCQYSSRYDKFKAGIIENAFKPELSNGALMDIGVYCVHPLVKLFGKPKSIQADAILLENGVDGAGTILARYKEMQAELIYSKITNSYIPSEIQGEDGCMLIDKIQDTAEITICNRSGEREVIRIEKEAVNMFYEAREWARLIQAAESRTAAWEEIWQQVRQWTEPTGLELQVMDEARAQMGIRFPADHVFPDGGALDKAFAEK